MPVGRRAMYYINAFASSFYISRKNEIIKYLPVNVYLINYSLMVEIQSQKVSQLIAFINALMTKFELLIGFIALYLILNSLALITQKP